MVKEVLVSAFLVFGTLATGLGIYHQAVGITHYQGFDGRDVHGCRVVLARPQ